MKKLVSKNIYFLLFYSALSVAGVWVYEKIIRPRKVQREIQDVVSEINAMAKGQEKYFESLFTGKKDSISKL